MITEEEKINTRKRECLFCLETLIPSRNDAKFCSDKCNHRAYTKRKSFSHNEEVQKPFILEVGVLHNKILLNVSKYNILGIYDFSDIVDSVPTNVSETCLIVRETGELLNTWYNPFSEPYKFQKCCKQLCPDSIIYISHLLIRDYEVKTGRSFIYRAAMDYVTKNSII